MAQPGAQIPDVDDALIQAAQAGDRSAFSALIDSHYDLIYRIAYHHLRNAEDAADVAQDTCVKLAAKLSSFRFESKFSTWLYRLTANTATDWQRRRQRRRERAMPETYELKAHGASPERQAAAREGLAAIEALPDKLRAAVLLVFRDGLNHREAAEELGCAETTVSWRIHVARKLLAEALPVASGARHA
jgi:RNA polymerase sigma-70 factor (ECF subfamily)